VWFTRSSPLYPKGTGQLAWAGQLAVLIVTGAAVYLAVCWALGVGTMDQMLPRRFRARRGGAG
jgi:hypothetical protein